MKNIEGQKMVGLKSVDISELIEKKRELRQRIKEIEQEIAVRKKKKQNVIA